MSKLNSYGKETLLALCLCATSCAQSTSTSVSVDARAEKSVPVEQKALLMPVDSIHIVYAQLNYPENVYRFYNSHLFGMVWQGDGAGALADSLLSFIKSVRLYGLLPQKYHVVELGNLKQATHPDSIGRKEALLTDAFLSIASDLKFGRLDFVSNPVKDSLNLRALENALNSKEIRNELESREPSYKQYIFLKKSLLATLSQADSTDRNLLLAGVTIDSIEVHKKVQRIEINMERWRSEKMDGDQRYIWINIPSFHLQVIENGVTILESRIIVGKPESPTPVLSSLIECITLYPYWYIPRKIAIDEYLPIIQKDTSFLTRNNFDVLDRKGNVLDADTLDWQVYTAKYFPISLRQREGPENSLGVIKFVFDNPYAVFLHDTNMKSLFRKETRMFSHGCIRMEKALELAKYLASDPEKIDSKLSLKERYTINLDKPIPIYTRYFTCEYILDELKFYADAYYLDKPIIDFLYKNNTLIPEHDQNQVKN